MEKLLEINSFQFKQTICYLPPYLLDYGFKGNLVNREPSPCKVYTFYIYVSSLLEK